MRRMIPQKFSDWIKSIKDKLYVKNNQVEIDSACKITGNIFVNLPTTDPQVAGELWNDSGTVKVSAGE